MPILDVEIVISEGEQVDPHLAATIAEAAGKIYASKPGETWVRLYEIPPDRYAENGGGPAEGVRPVFVRVLKASKPAPEILLIEVDRLARDIARICQRPVENVHILYEPPAMGRVAFGGKLLAPP